MRRKALICALSLFTTGLLLAPGAGAAKDKDLLAANKEGGRA